MICTWWGGGTRHLKSYLEHWSGQCTGMLGIGSRWKNNCTISKNISGIQECVSQFLTTGTSRMIIGTNFKITFFCFFAWFLEVLDFGLGSGRSNRAVPFFWNAPTFPVQERSGAGKQLSGARNVASQFLHPTSFLIIFWRFLVKLMRFMKKNNMCFYIKTMRFIQNICVFM